MAPLGKAESLPPGVSLSQRCGCSPKREILWKMPASARKRGSHGEGGMGGSRTSCLVFSCCRKVLSNLFSCIKKEARLSACFLLQAREGKWKMFSSSQCLWLPWCLVGASQLQISQDCKEMSAFVQSSTYTRHTGFCSSRSRRKIC